MMSIEVVTKTLDSDNYVDLNRHFPKMSENTFLFAAAHFVIAFFLTSA